MTPTPSMTASALTRELVRVPSESSDPVASDRAAPERRVAERLGAACRDLGIPHRLDEISAGRWNLVARLPRPGAPRVLIAGHLDTVSARGMTRPFDADLADGRIRGRGACDDKGPLAAAFTALGRLIAAGRQPDVDVTLLATADEESGMAGARAWARDGDAVDLVLDLEPTSLRRVVAHKGSYRCRIATTGHACHSSRPELGRNAIQDMLPLLSGVVEEGKAFARTADPLLGNPTLAITGISGGTAINVIPDACQALVDVRLVPALTPEHAASRIAARCAGATVTELYSAPALLQRPAQAGTSERFEAALGAYGVDLQTTVAPWCSDASFLQQLGPCLVWGPGSIEQAHTAEEFIDVAELERAADILARFLGMPA